MSLITCNIITNITVFSNNVVLCLISLLPTRNTHQDVGQEVDISIISSHCLTLKSLVKYINKQLYPIIHIIVCTLLTVLTLTLRHIVPICALHKTGVKLDAK